MKKALVYQASSRTGHYITPTPETEEQAIARRTKDWPKHDPDPRNCTGHGHAECMRQGTHSWFNHSQDSYHDPANAHLSNLPPGYVEQD